MTKWEKVEEYLEAMANIKNSLPAFGFIVFKSQQEKEEYLDKEHKERLIDLSKDKYDEKVLKEIYEGIRQKDVIYLNIHRDTSPRLYNQLSNIYNGELNAWVIGEKKKTIKNGLKNKKLFFFITERDLDNPVYVNMGTSVCKAEESE